MTRIAYRACRCSGVVRVDFIVTPEGKPYLIEINSIPGMSAGSIVPSRHGPWACRWERCST